MHAPACGVRVKYIGPVTLKTFHCGYAVLLNSLIAFFVLQVLVQGGDTGGGHYIVYVRPNPGGDWYKFDDENCTKATEEQALEGTYGANEGDKYASKANQFSSAYMLVYIRDDKIAELTRPVAHHFFYLPPFPRTKQPYNRQKWCNAVIRSLSLRGQWLTT